MKISLAKVLVATVLFVGFDRGAGAEELPPGTPPQRAPKVPEKQAAPSELPKQPQAEQAGAAELETLVVPELKGLVNVKSPGEIHRDGVRATTGLEVRDIALLSGTVFRQLVATYYG